MGGREIVEVDVSCSVFVFDFSIVEAIDRPALSKVAI